MTAVNRRHTIPYVYSNSEFEKILVQWTCSITNRVIEQVHYLVVVFLVKFNNGFTALIFVAHSVRVIGYFPQFQPGDDDVAARQYQSEPCRVVSDTSALPPRMVDALGGTEAAVSMPSASGGVELGFAKLPWEKPQFNTMWYIHV
jgi:hypothetical protein